MKPSRLHSPWTPWLFLAPFLLSFGAFFAWPAVRSLMLAFEQTYGPKTTAFVGLTNLRFLVHDPFLWTAVGNTVVFTIAAVLLQIPAALALALLLSPKFETLYHLNLVDHYFGIFLPAMAPAFGLYLFRQAMTNSLPTDILESARIDGCGEIRIFFTIVQPIIRPMISAYLLIVFIALWNDYITPQLILQSPELQPLPLAIFELKGLYGSDYSLIMAGTLVSIAPIMFLFILLQREFISGLTSGAVKG